MKIQKKEINLFFNLLKDSKVNLYEARRRDDVVRQLYSYSQVYESDRLKVCDKFCEKKDDELVVKNDNYIVLPEHEEEFKKEFEALNNEEVEVKVENYEIIKKIVENTEYVPKVGEMEFIDALIAKIHE